MPKPKAKGSRDEALGTRARPGALPRQKNTNPSLDKSGGRCPFLITVNSGSQLFRANQALINLLPIHWLHVQRG
jgi:hypothetical protein